MYAYVSPSFLKDGFSDESSLCLLEDMERGFNQSLNVHDRWRLRADVSEVSSRRLELRRENSVDPAESWSEEPAGSYLF